MDDNSRWIRLAGAANVRDLGGLPTHDDQLTKPGRALRADNLQGLTPTDVHTLVYDIGVRTVVDLRTVVEVQKEGPGPLTREPLVVHRHCSLFPEGGQMTDIDADTLLPWQTTGRSVPIEVDRSAPPDEIAGTLAVGFYLGYLRDRPDSVVAALRAMAGNGGASVVHCAAGKDRTGVVVALALSVAGVTRDAIIADYTATGDVLDEVLERLRNSPTYAGDLDDGPPDAHRPRPETLRRFLEVLDERAGGPVGWLTAAGFDDADADRLRARLLN
ncbi:MAG: protein-tyrosine phosphatase [Mycobacteriales bacterium]|jgi:protein tyrosine/serine phosphatase